MRSPAIISPNGGPRRMNSPALEFLMLAAVVAGAGVVLARAADAIAERSGLGQLIVGSVALAAATSLPELSVDIAAVRAGHADLAAGDLFGSSLMNLLILAGIDLCRRNRGKMLSREAASHAISATLGIALTGLAGCAILAAGRAPGREFLGISGWSWVILVAYFLGARMLFIDQRISASVAMETTREVTTPAPPPWQSVVVFIVAASVLVVAGPRLAEVADSLAEDTGLGGTFVGTTLVALTTSLPELVASLTAVRMGAPDLAIGNALGSNAFNMTLFVPLDLVHQGSFFQAVSPTHAVTAFAIVVSTSIAVLGQLYHVESRLPLIEPDALLVILVVVSAMGLVFHLS